MRLEAIHLLWGNWKRIEKAAPSNDCSTQSQKTRRICISDPIATEKHEQDSMT